MPDSVELTVVCTKCSCRNRIICERSDTQNRCRDCGSLITNPLVDHPFVVHGKPFNKWNPETNRIEQNNKTFEQIESALRHALQESANDLHPRPGRIIIVSACRSDRLETIAEYYDGQELLERKQLDEILAACEVISRLQIKDRLVSLAFQLGAPVWLFLSFAIAAGVGISVTERSGGGAEPRGRGPDSSAVAADMLHTTCHGQYGLQSVRQAEHPCAEGTREGVMPARRTVPKLDGLPKEKGHRLKPTARNLAAASEPASLYQPLLAHAKTVSQASAGSTAFFDRFCSRRVRTRLSLTAGL